MTGDRRPCDHRSFACAVVDERDLGMGLKSRVSRRRVATADDDALHISPRPRARNERQRVEQLD